MSGEPGGEAALGKNTEFCRQIDPAQRQAVREKRFALQRHMWRLLPGNSRLTACHVIAGKGRGGEKKLPEIRVRPRDGGGCSAHYGGVARCSAVWVCPVCAPAIAATRTAEIAQAREAWESAGGRLLLVTFTTRHSRDDELGVTIKGLRRARHRLAKHRRVREYLPRLGFVGKIAALEVTHGERNGWHPHLHELWFVDAGVDTRALHGIVAGLWADACEREGLQRPTKTIGFDVRGLREGSESYIVQGADLSATIGLEMTDGGTKRGRNQSRSLWELLMDSERGSARASELFREAAQELHGKAALFWSAGLKGRFAIAEKSDEQVTAERDSLGVAVLPIRNWHLVTRYRARAALLKAAEFGPAFAEALLLELEARCAWDLAAYLAESGRGAPPLGP